MKYDTGGGNVQAFITVPGSAGVIRVDAARAPGHPRPRGRTAVLDAAWLLTGYDPARAVEVLAARRSHAPR